MFECKKKGFLIIIPPVELASPKKSNIFFVELEKSIIFISGDLPMGVEPKSNNGPF